MFASKVDELLHVGEALVDAEICRREGSVLNVLWHTVRDVMSEKCGGE